MKKLIIMVLLTGLVAFPMFAQKGKKPPTPKEIKNDIDKFNKEVKKDFEKNKPPLPGNGNPNSPDFGKKNAADAKTPQEFFEIIDNNIRQAAQVHEETRAKIESAMNKLDQKQIAKTISQADYNLKKQALHDLEKQLKELEEKNQELKQKLVEAKSK